MGIPQCDKPAWVFLSLSMAGWNALAAAALTLGSAWGRGPPRPQGRKPREPAPHSSPGPAPPASPAALAEILRVDHAGELAAVHIYRGHRVVFEGRRQ